MCGKRSYVQWTSIEQANVSSPSKFLSHKKGNSILTQTLHVIITDLGAELLLHKYHSSL